MSRRTVHVRHGSPLHWLLTRTLATTTDYARAERSRLTWGRDSTGVDVTHYPPDAVRPVPRTPRPDTYRLRVIGVLHGLLGVTMYVDGPPS